MDNINSLFDLLRSRVKNAKLPMKDIATVILASIAKNFREGGRYNPTAKPDDILGGGKSKWKDYASTTKRSYAKKGLTTKVTLSRSGGGLRQSIAVQTSGLRVDVSANKKYARIHQLGGIIPHPGGTPYYMTKQGMRFMRKDGNYPKSVKFTEPHNIPMPSRPYLVVQPEDLQDILDLIAENGL